MSSGRVIRWRAARFFRPVISGSDRHVAPSALVLFLYSVFYKHVVRLGLSEISVVATVPANLQIFVGAREPRPLVVRPVPYGYEKLNYSYM